MSLKLESRIYVNTHNGEREIQLLLGDITELPLEEKVDVILISAFPNNYSALKGTVIGALKNNLRIDVQNLALYHKKEDLRTKFHCWLSTALPECMPYRQLLCFEKQKHGTTTLIKSVKEVFRAMMPIFNNENKSVITPLLATGSQLADRSQMLKVMVSSAVDWMKIGLPLQCLKIVIYIRDAKKIDEKSKKCIEVFETMKKQIEASKTIPKDPDIVGDVFLVCAEEDGTIAKNMAKFLKKIKKKAIIVSKKEVHSKEETWQHDIYMKMISCSRIVPLLSEAFLNDPVCLDEFNIAMCCNRRTRRNILAPVCLENVPNLPVYMGLVQWMNCKVRDEAKIKRACTNIFEEVDSKSLKGTLEYDVFISYSHKNLSEAKLFLETFQTINKDMKLFFDYDELKTGVSWQQTLYDSIDGSRCVIALLTPEYIKSIVCNEELSLALLKHLGKERSLELLPICLKEVDQQPFFSEVQPIKAYDAPLEDFAKKTCKEVCEWMKTGQKSEIFATLEDPLDFNHIAERERCLQFEKFYQLKEGKIKVLSQNNGEASFPMGQNIYISSSLRDKRYAVLFEKLVKNMNPESEINVIHSSEESKLVSIEKAACLVVLLSRKYIRSKREIEEFNLILSRERSILDRITLYVVLLEELPPLPSYMHLVPVGTCVQDDIWQNILENGQIVIDSEVISLKKDIEKSHEPLSNIEILAFMKAVCDVLFLVQNGALPFRGIDEPILQNIAVLKHKVDNFAEEMSSLNSKSKMISPIETGASIGTKSTNIYQHADLQDQNELERSNADSETTGSDILKKSSDPKTEDLTIGEDLTQPNNEKQCKSVGDEKSSSNGDSKGKEHFNLEDEGNFEAPNKTSRSCCLI